MKARTVTLAIILMSKAFLRAAHYFKPALAKKAHPPLQRTPSASGHGGQAILESPAGILGDAAVEDAWLTAETTSPEQDVRAWRRAQRMWNGPRPRLAEHAKSRRGGIRKPRQGGHIKRRTRS